MIPKLKDILDLLERIAPSGWAEPWDNTGLQVGSCSWKIKKVFIALDPTLRSLRSASEINAQLLFTHHPLIFKPLSKLNIDTYPGNVISESLSNGISIVAAHTNLDVAKGGINDILSELLDLQHVQVLHKTEDAEGIGLGRVGDLPEPCSFMDLIKRVKTIFGVENLRVSGREDGRIARIAVVGGSGGSMVSHAFEKGADLLLTGDVGHHHALEAMALGITLIDVGHFNAEKKAFSIFAARFMEMAEDEGWDIGVEIDDAEVDPVHNV